MRRRSANVAALTASGCGGSCQAVRREVELGHEHDLARPLLVAALAQLARHLVGRQRLELPVAVEEALHFGASVGPGPSMIRNQKPNASAATIAVDHEDAREHAVALVDPAGAADDLPDPVEPDRERERQHQRARSCPRRRRAIPKLTEFGVVVDLRADPQPARSAAGPTASGRRASRRRGRRPPAGESIRCRLAGPRVGRRRRSGRGACAGAATDEQAARIRGVVARHQGLARIEDRWYIGRSARS